MTFQLRTRSWGAMVLMALCAAWPNWLFMIDNCFTMGYSTPAVRKVALVVVGIAVPVILWRLGSTLSRLEAAAIAVVTWPLLGMLTILG